VIPGWKILFNDTTSHAYVSYRQAHAESYNVQESLVMFRATYEKSPLSRFGMKNAHMVWMGSLYLYRCIRWCG
jgi:hypothetical protein